MASVEVVEGEGAAVCRSVCTPLAAAVLQAAIDRITAAIATAHDDAIAELVSERRAMREELRAVREAEAGVARLEDARARLRPKP